MQRLPFPTAVATLLTAALVAGCGAGAPRHVTASDGVLAPELHVIESVLVCDPGGHAYCGSDLVVGGPSVAVSSAVLRQLQTSAVEAADWARVSGQLKRGLGAVSPDGKVYLSYATGEDELAAVRAGTLKRPRAVVRALRAAIHRNQPVLSIALSPGP